MSQDEPVSDSTYFSAAALHGYSLSRHDGAEGTNYRFTRDEQAVAVWWPNENRVILADDSARPAKLFSEALSAIGAADEQCRLTIDDLIPSQTRVRVHGDTRVRREAEKARRKQLQQEIRQGVESVVEAQPKRKICQSFVLELADVAVLAQALSSAQSVEARELWGRMSAALADGANVVIRAGSL